MLCHFALHMRSVKICIVNPDEDKACARIRPKAEAWKDMLFAACSQAIFRSNTEVLHASHAALHIAAHPEMLMMLHIVGLSLDAVSHLNGGAGWAGQGKEGAGQGKEGAGYRSVGSVYYSVLLDHGSDRSLDCDTG